MAYAPDDCDVYLDSCDLDPDGCDLDRDGRDVVPVDQGHAADDIFHAAVPMRRKSSLLNDPASDDNPIVSRNRAFERLSGYDAAEVLGRDWRFPQGPTIDRAAVARIRDGIGRREVETVARQAQRLEVLGAMASDVAHEFNNLVTAVLGSLAQVEKGLPPDRRERQRLDHAKWAGRRAGRLTQQMLSFARQQFHDTKPIDLNDVLLAVEDILRQVAGGAVAVSLDVAPGPLVAELDAEQLEMALVHLVRNAADAMPEGGRLVVGTRAVAGYDGGPGRVEIAVEDHGTGMPDAVVRRAVEPFFTTKPRGKGTGLGLSMVNGFAERSGGRLAIASEPGRGTAVKLSFPAKRQ